MARPSPASEADDAADSCPRCGGVGYFVDVTTNTTHRCHCEGETLAYRERLASAGIPRMFHRADFDNFEAPRGDAAREAVRDAAQSYAETFNLTDPEGLLLRGAPGTGKSHLAVAILRKVMRRGYTTCYRGFNDLLTEIRNSYDPNYPLTEEQVLRPLEVTDLVVLDDLGSETPKDFVRDRLYLIINRRYEARLPLIITTNCDSAELEVRVGRRTASRLVEMCSNPFPPFPDDDWRVRKGVGAPLPGTGRRKVTHQDPRVGRMK